MSAERGARRRRRRRPPRSPSTWPTSPSHGPQSWVDRPTSTARWRRRRRPAAGPRRSPPRAPRRRPPPTSTGRRKGPRRRARRAAHEPRRAAPTSIAGRRAKQRQLAAAEVARAASSSRRAEVRSRRSTGAGSMTPSRGRSSSDRRLRHDDGGARAATGGGAASYGPRAEDRTARPCSVAIVSDIHGNRHAFEAVLADVAGSRRRARSGAWATSSATAPTPTPASSWRASTARRLPGRQPRPGRRRRRSSLDEFSRGAALAARWTQEVIDAEHRDCLRALEPAGRRARASGSTTPSPRDPVWEYVLSRAAGRAVPRRPGRARLASIGHSHVALSFDAPRGRAGHRRDAPRRRRARRRRRASGCSTPAASASRATATRAPPGCCSTPTRWTAALAARPSTTSRAPQAAIRAARLPDSLAERLEYGQ